MKRFLCMMAGLVLGMNFFAHAMQQDGDGNNRIYLQLSCPTSSLRELDEAWNAGNQDLYDKRTQAYASWLSRKPVQKLVIDQQDSNIGRLIIKNKDLVTLSDISDDGIVTVFHEIPIKAEDIHFIDVSHNKLKELPLQLITLLCPHLNTLKAHHNALSYISMTGYQQQWNMTELDLSHNRFSDIDFDPLFDAYPALKTVNVSSNPLTTITWSGRWNRSENAPYYPDIYLRNTQVSPAEQSKVLAMYDKAVRGNIHRTIENASLVGALGGMLGGWAIGAIFARHSESKGILPGSNGMLESTLSWGAVGGSVTGLAAYMWHRSELKRLGQEVKEHVFFGELQEVNDEQ